MLFTKGRVVSGGLNALAEVEKEANKAGALKVCI